MIKIKIRSETKTSFLIIFIFSIGILWAFTGFGVLIDNSLIERELNWQIFILISIAGLVVLAIIYLPSIFSETVIGFKKWKNEHYKDGVLEI